MGHDHPGAESLPQLHGVLQRSERLLAPVLLGDGQPGEVGGMDGEAKVTLGRQLAKCLTLLLLPREALGEGQLEGTVTLVD